MALDDGFSCSFYGAVKYEDAVGGCGSGCASCGSAPGELPFNSLLSFVNCVCLGMCIGFGGDVGV